MRTVAINREHLVMGDRYSGKVPAYRCRSCKSTFVDPETEREFTQVLDLVARGLEPQGENLFEIRRETTGPARSFWSGWFGRDAAANDIVKSARGRAR
jgi:hypothetical protein